jgi:[ribosomal protein S5]-alanine N-acetyltransferase
MPSNLHRLRTPRLELVAATAEMLESDLAGHEELAEALGVEVPKDWPPMNWEPEPIEYLIHWMQRRMDAPGWFAWYCVVTPFSGRVHAAGENAEISSAAKRPAQVPGLNAGKKFGDLIEQNTLIGGLGFLGPPNAAGETAVGYSLLAHFHRQGYCTEALSALVGWAFSHSELKTLLIRTYQNHRPSIRVAEKLHFEFAGPGPEQDTVEYVLCREMWMKANPRE